MALLTVLPTKSDDNAADAMAIFKSVIAEPVSVVLFILGKPRGFERILEVALGRAEASRDSRRVLHAPDADVLDQTIIDDVKGSSGRSVVATYGLQDKIAARLTSGKAKDRFEVEEAFLSAEAQGHGENE